LFLLKPTCKMTEGQGEGPISPSVRSLRAGRARLRASVPPGAGCSPAPGASRRRRPARPPTGPA